MQFRNTKNRYNTESGILIVKRNYLKFPYRDISAAFYEADLYKTKRGEYFLCGHGGVLSVFKGRKEETIIPLEKEDAKLICKGFLDDKAYHKEFG
jgi:hypothetical protein